MALYINLLEGPTAAQAEPIFATRDPQLIADFAASLARRLGASAKIADSLARDIRISIVKDDDPLD